MKGDLHIMDNIQPCKLAQILHRLHRGKDPPQNIPPEIFLRPARCGRGCSIGAPSPVSLIIECHASNRLGSTVFFFDTKKFPTNTFINWSGIE